LVSYITNPENTIDPVPVISNWRKVLMIKTLIIPVSIKEMELINKNSIK
jgi:hypothetical protein